MTISSKHFEFLLQGSMRLLTAKQSNIAQTPVHHADALAQDIIPDDITSSGASISTAADVISTGTGADIAGSICVLSGI
ncbi:MULTISPECIES: hypothetical protein [unclassified Neorhizobium]|jgi:orotate phosphoribosyltransferase|uniref:hypothetical protein n=1 Tax=unclassified Neorhizobium TaxID=2629175 RepID=UPI001FF6A225|nr:MULTISPECIES: hypothetical protein [unclassified Neorhizobium]MCJ9674014.1 hypothetical protein [Neorhizobium sp. SHOUNA12B]MCJ9748896.1 hypothetical protein [Neorhizobium sp. SHOUNA12A]